MSSLAQYFLWQGKKVAGYDRIESHNTKNLFNLGAQIFYEDEPVASIPNFFLEKIESSLIIFSPALGNNNPKNSRLYRFFLEKKFKLIERHDFFSQLTKKYFTIAIAGSHGKTSTTAILSSIAIKSEKKTVAFLGGSPLEYGKNFLTNCSPKDNFIMIIEADEYKDFFLSINYDIGIVTTADPDHLDFFKTENNFNKSFNSFINGDFAKKNSVAIINDEVKKKSNLDSLRLISYSLNGKSNVFAKNIRKNGLKTKFSVQYNQIINQQNFEFNIAGDHQLENAVACITAASMIGVPENSIKKNLSNYTGVDRRFNILFKNEKYCYIDDFAHHPVELKNLLKTVKGLFSQKKILIIFQPHSYTRTINFFEKFVEELNKFQAIIFLEIFPAREINTFNLSSKDLFEKVICKEKFFCDNPDRIKSFIEKIKNPEIILTVGAGDIKKKTYNHIIEFCNLSTQRTL